MFFMKKLVYLPSRQLSEETKKIVGVGGETLNWETAVHFIPRELDASKDILDTVHSRVGTTVVCCLDKGYI